MKKMIDAEILLDVLDAMIVARKTVTDVYEVVEALPSAVITCGNCRWYKPLKYGGYCDIVIGIREPNHFCGYADRKDEETDGQNKRSTD